MNEWVTCPRCESKKILSNNKLFIFFALVFGLGVMTFIGLFFWPLLFITIPGLLLTPLTIFIPKINRCQECLYAWRANKRTTVKEM